MEFLLTPEGIGLCILALDLIAGWLPDKYTKYPGLILKLANKMYLHGKVSKK